jgi:hypothetical protein
VRDAHGVVVAGGVPLTTGVTPWPDVGGATADAALFLRARMRASHGYHMVEVLTSAAAG